MFCHSCAFISEYTLDESCHCCTTIVFLTHMFPIPVPVSLGGGMFAIGKMAGSGKSSPSRYRSATKGTYWYGVNVLRPPSLMI